MIFTNTGLTKDNVIFDFDISNIKSYDSNTGFTITSLTFWDNYISSDLTLTGYGQTAYDFGLVTSFTELKSYEIKDRNLIFNRIGYNDASGNTTFPQITLETQLENEGNSLGLTEGYLTTFFKIPERLYQLAPYRGGVGITIDTWIYIDQNTFDTITSYTEGFFLYMGTKQENKFNIQFSAFTDAIANPASKIYGLEFYDTNNYLDDIQYNAFGLKLNDDKTISLRYLGLSGLTTEIKTDKSLETFGWTNIVTTFRPCKKIINNVDELIDCVSNRYGDLKIYVNGKLFHDQESEEFFWLKQLNTDSKRQIGIPFSINWGGGSWGLKHSFMDSITSYTEYSAITTSFTYTLSTGATNLIIDGNYGTFEGGSGTTSGDTTGISTDIINSILTATTAQTFSGVNSLLIYSVPSAATLIIDYISSATYTGITNIISGGSNGSFEGTVTGITTDIADSIIFTSTTYVYSGVNSLVLSGTGLTYSSLSDIALIFDEPITLEINKRYIYQGKFYDDNSYSGLDKGVYLAFSGNLNSENLIFTSVTYTSTTPSSTWTDLKLVFDTPSIITGGSKYTPIVKINPTNISPNYSFYFDNFEIIKQDMVVTQTAVTIITGYNYTILSNILLDGDNGNFQNNVDNVSTPLTNGTINQVVAVSNYLGLYNNGGPIGGFSDVNGYSFVQFDTTLNLNPNTRYIFSGSVYDYARTYTSNQNIFLGFLDGFETQCTTLSSITFNTGSTGNTFYNLYYEFITPSSGTTNKNLTIKTDNTTLFNTNFFLFFDNFKLYPHLTVPLTAYPISFIFSSNTDNLVVFNTPLNIQPDKKYVYQGKFYDDNSYSFSGLNKGVYLTFSGGLDYEITSVTSVTYTSDTLTGTWVDLRYEFITPSFITGSTSYTPVVRIEHTTGITSAYKFYFDEFSIYEYDLINNTGLTGYNITRELLYNKNLNSIIQDNFDGSFRGKIQKLRMYDVDLDFNEIKKNYNFYSTKYGFTKLK